MKKHIILLFLIVPLFTFGQESVSKDYYENGNKLSEVHYKNGKRNGLWIQYWKNGQVWGKGWYKDGSISEGINDGC
jgi:antitoxin component YwqK of YwqJK toxin-antitoxin module